MLFVDGSWPECAERDETSDCFASSCSSGSYSLQDRPCGFCNGNEFTQLAMDVCGVCNGDNASCTCDGLSVGVLDACGQCEGAATACRYLESDPRMVGFLCTACCVLVLVAAMLLIVRKRLCKHPRKCGSIPRPCCRKSGLDCGAIRRRCAVRLFLQHRTIGCSASVVHHCCSASTSCHLWKWPALATGR